jgi:ribosomal protein L29
MKDLDKKLAEAKAKQFLARIIAQSQQFQSTRRKK